MTEASGAVVVEKELDALVAERVFGRGTPTHEAQWKHGRQPGDGYGDFVGWWCVLCHGDSMPPMVRIDDERPDPETHHNYRVLPYSTSISDAWRVVERMRELGWMFELYSLNHTTVLASRWSAHFYTNVRSIKQGDAIEAPRAICLAALKAVSAAGALREKGE